MKLIKGLIFALLGFMLWGCSSDEPVPVSYAEGKYDSSNSDVELIYNGEKVSGDRIDIVMYKDDEERRFPGSNADARIVLKDRIFVISEDDPLFPEGYEKICHYNIIRMEFDVKLTSSGDKVLFEGMRETYRNGNDYIRYYIDGYFHYYGAAFGDIKLHANVRSEVHKEGLTGRTFEMRFGDETPVITDINPYSLMLPQTGLTAGSLVEELRQLSASHYVERSGFDAMRFTFKEDGTIDVEGHSASDGSYMALDTDSHYFMAKGEEYDYFLFQWNLDWALNTVTKFSPYVSLSPSFENSCFDFSINLSPRKVMMATVVGLRDDSLIITRYSGLCHDPEFKNSAFLYLKLWTRNPLDSYYQKHNDLLYAAQEGELSFNVDYIAHPVD